MKEKNTKKMMILWWIAVFSAVLCLLVTASPIFLVTIISTFDSALDATIEHSRHKKEIKEKEKNMKEHR